MDNYTLLHLTFLCEDGIIHLGFKNGINQGIKRNDFGIKVKIDLSVIEKTKLV